jgi:hypothetical protein
MTGTAAGDDRPGRSRGRLRAITGTAIALVVLSVWGSAAQAGPIHAAQAEGDCVEIVRDVIYSLTDTITPGQFESPEKFGKPKDQVPKFDPKLLVTYCMQGGVWHKTKDAFPYDSPNVCVDVYPSEGGHPAVISPLEQIDSFGIEPIDSPTTQTYCRSGNTWQRKSDPGSGDPPQGCMEVLRWVYKPPASFTPPDDPTKIGHENPISVDERFLTTYCQKDGKWQLTKDNFPYDDPNEQCIDIRYDPDAHDGHRPPDLVVPRTRINDYGPIDASGGANGDLNGLEHYCHKGVEDSWTRGARTDDYPKGPYQTWAEKCVTVALDPGKTAPKKMTDDPKDLGTTDIASIPDRQLATIAIDNIPTYCLKDGTWFRVDDYPLGDVDPRLKDRLSQPDTDRRCVVIKYPETNDRPEILPELGSPGDLGGYVGTRYPGVYDADTGQYNITDLYCYVNGRWRRGDKLRECGAKAEDTNKALLPDGCWQGIPDGNYDINYDAGSWNDFQRKITGWWTDFFFGLGKGATQISLWATSWAYTFDMSKYDKAAILIGNGYETNLTKNPQFHLMEFMWLILMAWVGFNALKGKLAMAGGELLMSFVLILLSSQLMLHRAEYMSSTWDLMDKAAVDLLVTGQGHDPTTNEDDIAGVVEQVQDHIHSVFVEQPYDYLNWGHPLVDDPKNGNDCADTRNFILALGPHETDDWPRDMMKKAGCNSEVEFNAKPSSTRLLSSLLSMTSSFIVSFVLLAVSLTVVVSKFVALVLFALAPFATLVAVLPGSGRRVVWLWATTLLQVVVAVIGMSLLLSVLLLGVDDLVQATESTSLTERFFIVNLAVLGVALGRRRMLAGGQASAGRLTDNLTNVRVGGGGAAWQGPSGSHGVNLLNLDRGMRYAAWGGATLGGAAVTAVGRSISQRMRERRAWHNQVKARRRGDRMQSVQPRTYIRSVDAPRPVDSSAPGPRSGGGYSGGPGYPGSGPGPGPGPGPAPGPAPGTGPRPGPGPGPATGPTPTGGVVPPSTQGIPPRPMPTSSERAARAQRRGDTHGEQFWTGMHHNEAAYHAAPRATPVQEQLAREEFSGRTSDLRDSFAAATGQRAPMVREPWAPSVETRPGLGAQGTGAHGPRGGPTYDGRHTFRELVVTEYYGGWSHPAEAIKDRLANYWSRQRAQVYLNPNLRWDNRLADRAAGLVRGRRGRGGRRQW